MGSLTVSSPPEAAASTTFERRLRAEFRLLADLVARNPQRLAGLSADDSTRRLTLRGTPARSTSGAIIDPHRLRLQYPRFFPALPLELYLDTPVFHPNVHPETGFVCLWDRHCVAHTAEDALHKTVAILGWRLFNLRPEHTMQPNAAALPSEEREHLIRQLDAAPLFGVRGVEVYPPAAPGPIRRRLS
jgi:ubiquitin-protein ligase